MSSTFITTGLACVIAAIIGGGLKAFGIEIPVLQSGRRQLVLAAFGIGIVAVGLSMTDGPPKDSRPADESLPPSLRQPSATPSIHNDATPTAPPTATPTAPTIDRVALLAEKESNKAKIDSLRKGLSDHAEQIAEQQRNISLQEQRIARGEGTPEMRAEAQAEIGRAYAGIAKAQDFDARVSEFIGRTEQRNSEIDRLLGTGGLLMPDEHSQSTSIATKPAASGVRKGELLAQHEKLSEKIASLKQILATDEDDIRDLQQRISSREQSLARGDGAPEERARTQATIQEWRAQIVKLQVADTEGHRILGLAEQGLSQLEYLLAQN